MQHNKHKKDCPESKWYLHYGTNTDIDIIIHAFIYIYISLEGYLENHLDICGKFIASRTRIFFFMLTSSYYL